MGKGSYITLFSTSAVTAFHKISKYDVNNNLKYVDYCRVVNVIRTGNKRFLVSVKPIQEFHAALL